MFRQDNKKIHISLGILMMGAQVLGAYLAALYMAFLDMSLYPMKPSFRIFWFSAMMQEIIGTFIFVMFFKIATDERLYFSKEMAINCFLIASSYIAARSIVNGTVYISTYGACLNPAVAVGISLVSVIGDAG